MHSTTRSYHNNLTDYFIISDCDYGDDVAKMTWQGNGTNGLDGRSHNSSDHLSGLPITMQPAESQLILSIIYIICITLTLCGHLTQFMVQVHYSRLHKQSHVQHFLAGFFVLNTLFSFGIPWAVLEILIRHWPLSRSACRFYQLTVHVGRSVLPYIVVGLFAVTNMSLVRAAKHPERHSVVSAACLAANALIMLVVTVPILGGSMPLSRSKLIQESLDKTSNMTYDILQCDLPIYHQSSLRLLFILLELIIPVIICTFLAVQLNAHVKHPALFAFDPVNKLLILIGVLHFTGNIMHYFPPQKTLAMIENNFPNITYRHFFAILPYVSSSVSWIPASYLSVIWHKYEIQNMSPCRMSRASNRSVRFLISPPTNQVSIV